MTVQATSTSLAPAAVTTRVIALIIDAIILGICSAILGLVIADTGIVSGIIRAIIYAALGFVYFGYTWTAWRASPGQRVLGLMTVNEADGAAVTWSQATTRWAFLFGPSILSSFIGGGLGALLGLIVFAYGIYLLYTTATDPRKQGFHDKQAKTLVITKIA